VRTGFWWGNLRKRDQLEDLGLDGRIILRWIFGKMDLGGGGGHGLHCSALEWGRVAGSCECGNEPPGFIKLQEIS
jgi:hypothetical protein